MFNDIRNIWKIASYFLKTIYFYYRAMTLNLINIIIYFLKAKMLINFILEFEFDWTQFEFEFKFIELNLKIFKI